MQHTKVYVPRDTRACNFHLDHFNWHSWDIATESHDFTKEYIEDMFNVLTNRTLTERGSALLSE